MRPLPPLALLAAALLAGAQPAGAGEGATCVAPPPGLVSWWPADEGGDDVAGDHDATFDDADTAPGHVGDAFSFDGTDDSLSVADDPSFTQQVFTLVAWFRASTAANDAAAFLVARSGPSGTEGFELGVRPAAGNVLRFTLNGGAAGADLTGTTDVFDDAFHLVVASYDGERMRLFLDGALEAELAIATAVQYTVGAPLHFGRRELTSIPGFWNGLIDEVQFYAGSALCPTQAAGIFAAGSAGQCFEGEPPPCLDPFLCYKAKTSKGGPGFEGGGTATLDGPFESLPVTVKKPAALCLPADVGGAVPDDEVTHLESYAIKPSATPFTPRNVAVTTAFGTLQLETLKVDRMLLPTTKSLEASPEPPELNGLVDFFQCFTVKSVKGAAKFPKGVSAEVAEQFEAARTLDLKKPRRFCVPVGVEGTFVAQPGVRLLCYAVKPAKGEPRHTKRAGVFVANISGPEQLDTVKEEELCVPAAAPLVQ